MAKKALVRLSNQNLSFDNDRGQNLKLLNINPNSMNLDVAIYEKNLFIKNSTIAFAHIPKKLKAKIKPLC
ncbi:malate dehydrogenase [Malaciobacter marinus]|uniref:malate dehydrogenase n=1 Tax=Malaciobacter marinus TaxID=505249 RepID=UPI003B00DCC1